MTYKQQRNKHCIRNKLKKLVRSDIHCYEILGEESEDTTTYTKEELTTVNMYTNPIGTIRQIQNNHLS